RAGGNGQAAVFVFPDTTRCPSRRSLADSIAWLEFHDSVGFGCRYTLGFQVHGSLAFRFRPTLGIRFRGNSSIACFIAVGLACGCPVECGEQFGLEKLCSNNRPGYRAAIGTCRIPGLVE